mgnify:FL=1
MLYIIKNSCIFVVSSNTTRYDYAYTEVRGEFVCNGSQATDQDCKVWKISSTNHPEGEYPSCRGQEWKETHDRPGSRYSVQHIRYDSAECANQLWKEGSRGNSSAKEKGNAPGRSQSYGRGRGSYYSFGLWGSSQWICQMDTSPSCRQVGPTEVYRFDISYAGWSHSKKNEYKPHLKKCWCIPSSHSAAFVAAMEDVLEVYSRPYDENLPVVCMDEKPVQLLAQAREGFTSNSTGIRYEDHEYIRNGTCSIFLFTEPLAGWRHAEAKQQRTRKDWAERIKWLLDERYPNVQCVILVCDNLNTHNIASLYEAFEPEEALRLAKRLEIHHTPKHGSWLDIAEIELSALGNQCLYKRRISSVENLNEELLSWNTERNAGQKSVNWQFKTADARTKLKHLYPILNF